MSFGLEMKRSLGPRFWLGQGIPQAKPATHSAGLRPLQEGPVYGAVDPGHPEAAAPLAQPGVKAYARGSLNDAIRHASTGPERCAEHITKRAKADTSRGPYESRKSTWSALARAAGFSDPFRLSPDLINTVMGAMGMAGYRSAELYMDTAKQIHIERGLDWTAQLAQASRQARRACQRGRGPAKQAQPLPMIELAKLKVHKDPAAPGGPIFPMRSVMLASWWLLREIEASSAERSHIEIDKVQRLIHWKLPSSKADWQALGATRTHSCNCEQNARQPECPYHAMVEHLEAVGAISDRWVFPSATGEQSSKCGWADTMQCMAQQLNLPTHTDTGARRFTGHSARATGAVYLAMTQIELWRIQLFGRWGSECFRIYIRDAPLQQLHSLAKEASLTTSLAAARAELSAILSQAQNCSPPAAAVSLRNQSVDCLADCEAAVDIAPQSEQPASVEFVINRSAYGKIHKVACSGPTRPHYLWCTQCNWYFARGHADYALASQADPDKPECNKCFKPKQQKLDDESSTSSSSSSES